MWSAVNNLYSQLKNGVFFSILAAEKQREAEIQNQGNFNENIRNAPQNSNSAMKIKVPELVRQFLAETLGTFLLVMFGDGAIAQLNIARNNNFTNVALGYGFALMIGILVSGGVSGGHLNPAVTLAMAVVKKCKWIQVKS